MTKSLLEDAFAHHVWATQQVLATCQRLDAAQLEATADGTYGSIIETLRHLVGADGWYLFAMTGGRVAGIDTDTMSVDDLAGAMERNEKEWTTLLAGDPDPAAIVVRHRDDGSESHAPMGIRLAQALHHGTDHRSQVCTVLTTLGIEPPAIDVWDYADSRGWLKETPPTS